MIVLNILFICKFVKLIIMKRVNFLVRFLSIAAMLLCVSCRDEIEPLSEDSDEENLISSELLEVVSFGENRSIDEILDGVNRSSGVNHSRSSIKSLTIKDSLKLADDLRFVKR